MSGGSLDYACYKVESIADAVREKAATPLHHAFADHLVRVAAALHDLEWVWSCDYGPGDEVTSIRSVLSPVAEIESAIDAAKKAMSDLQSLIDEAERGRT